jgi:signal transduction histidine kinase
MMSKPARDPLLAAICHDLRAPLAAVTMGTNFVLQTTEDDAAHGRQRRILEAMLRSCSQMERLVRNFADLSEIEGGSLVLRAGEHDAQELLELAATTAAPSAAERDVSLVVDDEAPPLVVTCDRERMLRALGHVVDNAVRVAPEGSEVALSVKEEDDGVVFRVTDRGPGIPSAMRENLFDRAWHAANSKRVGTGFGLAIARGFAAAHGGRIDVASKPGETVFALVLPRPQRAPRVRSGRRRRSR